jgi:hypothetical protein
MSLSPSQLDEAYTRLCDTLNQVGEANASLFLATLSLSLIARHDRADDVLSLIEQARVASTEETPT